MIYICNIYTIYTYVDIGIPCTYVSHIFLIRLLWYKMYCIRLWSKYISGCQRLSGYFTHINSMTKRKYHNYIYFMKKSSMKCHINTTLTSTPLYLLCKQACILLHNRSPAMQYLDKAPSTTPSSIWLQIHVNISACQWKFWVYL